MKKTQSPLVPIAACVVAQVCVGIIYAWSALRASAISYYGWSGEAATLVASFMLFAFCIGNFAGGALNDRIGPKKVCLVGIILFGLGILLASFLRPGSSVVLFYISYGVVGGLGSGITYGAVLTCMQKWFPHKRGFATGLAAGAFGFSTFVFSFVIKAMLKTMSISATLLVLSIIFLAVGICACLFIRLPGREYLDRLPTPAAKKGAIVSGEDKTFSQAVRTVPFWCLFLGIFFYNGTWNMLNPIIRDLGMERGLSADSATLLLSLTGLFNAAGRLIMSSLSDRLGRIPTMHILSAATIVCALLLMFTGGFGYFIIVLLTAFAFGGPAAINPATSTDFFGPRYAGTNYGVIMLALGFSSIIFNSISGKLVAATGSYMLTFIMGAVTAAITIVLMMIISSCLKKNSEKAK